MSKKQTSTQNSTSTPIIPADIQAGFGQFGSKATGYLGQNPTDFRAAWNPFQQEALDRSVKLGGNPNAYNERAAGILDLVGNYKAPQVTAASLLEGLDKYMSPYTGQVVDTTLAGFDRDQARTLGALDLAQAGGGAGAFGGSGAGLARGTAIAEGGLNRAQIEAGLRDQGFQVGAGLSAQDAASRQRASEANAQMAMAKQQQGLQIAQLFGDMGNNFDASRRADIATLSGAGNNLYNVQNTTASAPLDVLQQLQQIYSGIAAPQIGKKTVETATLKDGGVGILGSLGTLGLGLGALGYSPFGG